MFFAGLFLLPSGSPWYIYTRVCLTIPPLNLDCFQFGVITNKAVINKHLGTGFYMNHSFYYLSRIMLQSIISGSHCSLISLKKKILPISCQSSCTILYFYQQCMSDPVSSMLSLSPFCVVLFFFNLSHSAKCMTIY